MFYKCYTANSSCLASQCLVHKLLGAGLIIANCLCLTSLLYLEELMDVHYLAMLDSKHLVIGVLAG